MCVCLFVCVCVCKLPVDEVNAGPRMCLYVCMWTVCTLVQERLHAVCFVVCLNMYTQARKHTRMSTPPNIVICIYTQVYIYIYIYIHMLSHKYIYMHSHARTHAHTNACATPKKSPSCMASVKSHQYIHTYIHIPEPPQNSLSHVWPQ